MKFRSALPSLLSIFVLLVLIYGAAQTNWNAVGSIPSSPTPTTTAVPSPVNSPPPTVSPVISASMSPAPTATPSPTNTPSVVAPIAQFKARITKKNFGTYVTPNNSPVSPEKFTGYHTGIDVEYTDISTDVPVLAIADGTVVTSRYASGYGGVMVIQHRINSKTVYAIYGHLRQSSMLAPGKTVSHGEQIAVLGTGYSSETDGERRHLHFGIATQNTITGYVATEAELNATWVDPLSYFP